MTLTSSAFPPLVATRQQAAAAAAAACGVGPDEGRAWMEAAKQGHVTTLASMLAANPKLLHYQAS